MVAEAMMAMAVSPPTRLNPVSRALAAMPINPAIDMMGQDRNVSVLTERTDT